MMMKSFFIKIGIGLCAVFKTIDDILDTVLSWTFSDEGFDVDELNSLDKADTTSENSRLVDSYCVKASGSGEQLYYNGVFPTIGTNDMELEFYCKMPVIITDFMCSIGRSYFGGVERYFVTTFGGQLIFHFQPAAAKTYTVQNSYANYGITDGAWHHYKMVVDRDGNMEAFIDGSSVGTTNVSAGVSDSLEATNYFRIGAFGSAVNGVQGAGTSEYYGVKLTIGSTVYEWPLQGSGYDISGNGLHLTNTNADLNHTQYNYHYNMFEGCDIYLDDATSTDYIYVPYVSGSPIVASIAGYTKQSSNVAGDWHNGCETKFVVGATTYDTGDSAWNVDALVQAADTDHILHSASTGYGIAQGYSDMKLEQSGYLFMDTSTTYQYKDVLLFSSALTYSDAISVIHYLNGTSNLVKDASNHYVFDANGFPIWV